MTNSKKNWQKQLKSLTAGHRQLRAFDAKLFVGIMPPKETIP